MDSTVVPTAESVKEQRMATELKLALRPRDAAAALGVSRDLVFQLIASGELRSFRVGNARVIPVASLEEYIARRLSESDYVGRNAEKT